MEGAVTWLGWLIVGREEKKIKITQIKDKKDEKLSRVYKK